MSVLGALAEQRDVPAEVSVAAGTTAVGVLVPVIRPELGTLIARSWGFEKPPWPASTFVRCDMDAGAWVSVAFYRDAHKSDFVSPISSAPVQYVAERWLREDLRENSLYVQVAGLTPEALGQAARDMGEMAGLSPVALDIGVDLAERAARIGWTQTYAAISDGPAPRIKLGISTSRVEDALALLPNFDLAAELRHRFRQLRTTLGYAGLTIHRTGGVGLRLYAMPMQADQLACALRTIA